MGTQGPFPVATGIYGILSIFKRSQASTPFKVLNSVFLSSCQRAVRLPVEMRWGTRAFSRVSTGDSDIPSCCEVKDEPAFKAMQGNQDNLLASISVSIPLEAAHSGSFSHTCSR